MAAVRFLDVNEASAEDRPWPDVYFSPGYGRAVEVSDAARWEVAMFGDGRIIYPYLRRELPGGLGAGGFDLVSPYGYSGTYVADDVTDEEVRAFRTQLSGVLRERGAVAEFQRLSGLVSGAAALLRVDETLRGSEPTPTVAIDLRGGYDAAWSAAEGRSRTKTRKARRLGYEAEVRPCTLQDVRAGGAFRELYDATMRRVRARPYYLFPDAYYERLLTGLEDRLWVAEVRDPEGVVGAAGIFMCWAPLLHLHLVGSDPAATRDGAGNLLYDAVIAWGAHHGGYERLHVGGGMTPGDSMFAFKKSFGGEEVLFRVARGVFDPQRYAELVRARARQCGCSPAELEDSGYFPAYRAG